MDRPLKILMATMSMDIGGAETHIVELSKTLSRRGHSVTVASNGGVYVAELEEAGIRHVSVPMHRRSVPDMVKSYLALKRLIRREGFDVVHAHARIPGFLCGLVRRRVKFPFVTTAHWVFSTGGLAGRLTNWGQKTIAVSDDIKAYLMEGYQIPEGDIVVTVNGIDMDRFSPEADGSALRREFSIPCDAPVITHVSRLDEGRSLVAGQLIEAAEALAEKIPELHILIAGGGDQFDRLSAQAQAVNRRRGRTLIHMAGPRTDINSIISAGNVFVGVSRAALEAMSAARPVVVAGDEGYIGIFDSERLSLARSTNFCCRGCEPSSAEKLLGDLLTLLAMDTAKRQTLGVFGRETVRLYYSVETMTDDALEVYRAVLTRTRILLSGYYGFNNAGDEALLNAFMQSVKNLPEAVDVTVLSNAPEQTKIKYGCNAVPRFNPAQVLWAIRGCDALVSGGGSLLQDMSSTRSIVYYLAIIRLAKLMGKPVMLYANGIGPVNRPKNRRRVTNTVSRADVITLREESSLEELCRMGVSAEAHVTADPIFLLKGIDRAGAQAVLSREGVPLDTPLIGLSVRSLNISDSFICDMARFADDLTRKYNCRVVFIAMHMPNDRDFSQKIVEQMDFPAHVLCGDLSSEELIGVCGLLELVITMRLHTMLFAAKARVPIIGLICDPKIEYFLEKLEMPSGGRVEDFDPDRLLEDTHRVLSDLKHYRDRLEQPVSEMERLVGDNERYLSQLLELI